MDRVYYFGNSTGTWLGHKIHLLSVTIIIICFTQAARVTREGGRLKNNVTAIRARPFRYTNTPRADLDSLIQYTQAVHLRVIMFFCFFLHMYPT